MKYYILKISNRVDGIVPFGLDGKNVSQKKEIFGIDKCGPNSFLKKDYEFDYLVPIEFGNISSPLKSGMLLDIHQWHGEFPIGGWFVPISKKFKNLLSNFNLLNHKFYNATVMHEGVKHPYFVLQVFRNSFESFVDFNLTEFNNMTSSRRLDDRELNVARLNSIEEVKKYSREVWGSPAYWNFEKLVMKPNFKSVDLVNIIKLGDIVSQKLKMAIQEAQITGVSFEELPIPIEFSDEV